MSDLARLNCLASSYSWIAMLHYAKAKELLLSINEDGIDADDAFVLHEKGIHYSYIAITFSAMTLESYFNDYGARTFGDKFFYENFDKLSAISKVQLISKFYFGKEIKKDSHLFQLLGDLFKNRNALVHNKSKDAFEKLSRLGYSFDEVDFQLEDIEIELEKTIKMYRCDLEESIENARNAIKALYETALYFDEQEPMQDAMFSLVRASAIGEHDENDLKAVQSVQKEFGIPLCNVYEETLE